MLAFASALEAQIPLQECMKGHTRTSRSNRPGGLNPEAKMCNPEKNHNFKHLSEHNTNLIQSCAYSACFLQGAIQRSFVASLGDRHVLVHLTRKRWLINNSYSDTVR